jgi:hypothetical protein
VTVFHHPDVPKPKVAVVDIGKSGHVDECDLMMSAEEPAVPLCIAILPRIRLSLFCHPQTVTFGRIHKNFGRVY